MTEHEVLIDSDIGTEHGSCWSSDLRQEHEVMLEL